MAQLWLLSILLPSAVLGQFGLESLGNLGGGALPGLGGTGGGAGGLPGLGGIGDLTKGLGALGDLTKLFEQFGGLTKLFQGGMINPTDLFGGSSGFTSPFGKLPGGLEGLTGQGGGLGSSFGLFQSAADSPILQQGINGGLTGGLKGAFQTAGNFGPADKKAFFARMKECRNKMNRAMRPLRDQVKKLDSQLGSFTSIASMFGGSKAKSLEDQIFGSVDQKMKELTQCENSFKPRGAVNGNHQVRQMFGALTRGTRGMPNALPGMDAMSGFGRFGETFNFLGSQGGMGVGDFGRFLEMDSSAVCKQLVDAEFRDCQLKADQMCEMAGMAEKARSFNLDAMKDMAKKFQDFEDQRRRNDNSKTNCRCIGQVLPKTAKAGAKTPACVGNVQSRIRANSEQGASEGVVNEFLLNQKPRKPLGSILPSTSGGFKDILNPSLLGMG